MLCTAELLLCVACVGTLAIDQSSMIWRAQSITFATVSVTPCQSRKFRCFHKLKSRAANCWLWAHDITYNKEKIAAPALLVCVQARCTAALRQDLSQICCTKEHSKKLCCRFSGGPSQITHSVGQLTPFSAMTHAPY